MYQKTGKRVGLALLCAAVTIRALAATGVDARAAKALAREFDAGHLAAISLAMAVSAELPEDTPPERRVWVVKVLPKKEEPPAPKMLSFTAQEAEAIAIGGKSSYAVDKAALLTASTKYEASEAPTVLILHTHTSEAYTQTAGWTYTESDPLRTTEDAHSVVRVGQEVAAVLERRGISVIHDTSYNDYPDYNSAYANAKTKTQTWLEKYPSIQVVIDLHRDAIEDENGAPVREAVTLTDGTSCAKLMLVVGTDQGGLSHPHWQDNLSLSMKVQAAIMRSTPALCKAIDLRTERFNQHLSPGALLVEVGSTGNTLPEALTAAKIFADGLADVLVGV